MNNKTGEVTIVAAGTTTITATAAAADNLWAETTASYTLTVNKANVDLQLAVDKEPKDMVGGGKVTLTVTGAPNEGTVAVACNDRNVTIEQSATVNNVWTADLTAATTAKTYTFTATYTPAAQNPNYNAKTVSETVTVPALKNITATAQNVSATYDTTAKSITVTVTDPANGATIQYSTDGGKTWSANNPTRTDVGTTTVTWKVTAVGYTDKTASNTITVNAAEVEGTVAITGTAKVGQTLTADITGLTKKDQVSYKWTVGTATTPVSDSNTYVVTAADAGKTIKLTVTSAGNYVGTKTATTDAVVKLDGPAAPTGLAGVSTVTGQSVGKITGTNAAMEYKLQSAASYTAVTGSEITGLAKGTYLVRVAETTDTQAGATAEVVVGEKAAAPTGLVGVAPDTNAGNGKITGTAETMEYNIKGSTGSWIPCTADETEVSPDQTYVVRIKATNEVEASDVVEVVIPAYGKYAVNIAETTNGAVTASPTNATKDEEVTLTVTPDTGYQLKTLTITDGEGNAVEVAEGKFTMPESAVTVTAVFEAIEYTVTVAEATNGTVTTVPAAKATVGESVVITATPSNGYKLNTLTVKDADNSAVAVANNTFTMPAKNVTVTATFAVDLDAAKTKVAGATYSATQANCADEAAAKTAIENVIKALNLPAAITTTVNKTAYVAPVAGTSDNRNGTNGSYTFTVTLAADQTSVTTITLTLTVTATAYSSGTQGGGNIPSGGGGGASEEKDESTKPETVTKEDGSTVTTETKKDGTKVETTTTKEGDKTVVETAKDGTVTTTVETSTGVKAESVKTPEGEVTATVELPKAEQAEPVEGEEPTDEVASAPIILPVEAVPVGKATITVKTEEPAKIIVPVEEATTTTVAVIVHEDGTEEIVKASVLTEDGMALTVDGETTIKLIDNSKEFTDVGEHWASDYIDFVSAREMVNGTSTTEFSPEETLTRGMLMTILARFDGEDTTPAEGETWYSKGMEWAVKIGISDGTMPQDNITREQLATMLYRYAGYPEAEEELDNFTDASGISGWAQAAMKWAVKAGIMNGRTTTTLAPTGTATRAEAAAMIMRFVNNLVK